MSWKIHVVYNIHTFRSGYLLVFWIEKSLAHWEFLRRWNWTFSPLRYSSYFLLSFFYAHFLLVSAIPSRCLLCTNSLLYAVTPTSISIIISTSYSYLLSCYFFLLFLLSHTFTFMFLSNKFKKGFWDWKIVTKFCEESKLRP